MPTWSGSFTNETVSATPYQAKNGVRGVLNMDIIGDFTVIAPPEAENVTFSLHVKNPDRATLTIQPSSPIETPDGRQTATVELRLKSFVIGFTFVNGKWNLSDFISFTRPVGVKMAVQWEPRNSNGLCQLIDSYRIDSVERTAKGFYTVTTDGTTIDSQDIIQIQPYVLNLPAENSPEVNTVTQTPTTLNLETGLRNRNGRFDDDDLTQDPLNRVLLLIQEIP